MTITKLTLPAKDNAVQSKVNDIIDELGNKLENTATGTNSLSILGESNAYNYGTAIGDTSRASTNGTSLGYNANAAMDTVAIGYKTLSAGQGTSIAIGKEAKVVYEGQNSIQIGTGTNSTAYSLAIGFNNTNYQLLDGTTGLIPDARISTNIARTSQIPTVPTNISSFTNDSGYITGITSADVTNALGYTPYNSSNPSGYTSNVGTVTSVNNTSPDTNGNVTISIPSISNLADKDLSNLSATGQAVIDGKADTSLSNITNTAKIAIAHNAMPSNTYTDLTLGASGTTYTAPANGYFCIKISNEGNTGDYQSYCQTSYGGRIQLTSYSYCSHGGAIVPMLKGQTMTFIYEGSTSDRSLIFVYAQGSESEAS